MKTVFVILMLAAASVAQGLPDSPSAGVPAERTCGPKWLGGCYDDSAPKHSTWEVVKDPYFYVPTLAEFGFASWDGWMTSQRHNFCSEANNDLGPNPSTAKIVGINLLIEGVVTGFRFTGMKIVPKGRTSKIMRGVSIGLASISVERHARGVYNWYHSGCL